MNCETMEKRKNWGEQCEVSPLLPSKKFEKNAEIEDDYEKQEKFAKHEKLPSKTSVSVLQLFRFASSRDIITIIVGSICASMHGAGMPILGFIFGHMANSLAYQNSERSPTNSTTGSELMSKMNYYCALYAGLGVITFFSTFMQTFCWETVASSLVFKLRKHFFRQVLRQELNWFDENQTGELTQNLLDDIERFQEGVGQNFSNVIQYMASVVFGVCIGFATCWRLTIVAIALSPFLSLKASIVGLYGASKLAEEKKQYAKAECLSIETFSCNRTVAAFGGEKREIQKYRDILNKGLRLFKKRIFIQAAGIGFSYFTIYACKTLAFWYGGKLIYSMIATPGSVLTVMTSTIVGIYAIGHAIPYFSIITNAQCAAHRIYEVIDTLPFIDPYDTTGVFLAQVTGKIELNQVCFAYPARNSMPVLKRLNFTVSPGTTIGIVGTSGSGKSTIINLLLRFYDLESGKILLDGYNIKSLNLHWLRNQIGYVSQDPVLFSTTIYENILLGTTKEATPEEVFNAAKMANVHDFILSLPQGYDTPINGTKLSGGQKQRIVIARAILSNPKILLLDEATSALDGKSEALVQVGLRKAKEGRTTIVVAHRLSTIRDADVIYAIKDGEIAESGTHEELIEKGGLYFDLVAAQSSMEAVEETDPSHHSLPSTIESADETATDFEFQQEWERRRTLSRRLSMPMEPTSHEKIDKAQLLKELKECKLEVPSLYEVLSVNRQWKILGFGIFGSVLAGLVRPAFACIFGQMTIVFTSERDDILPSTEFLAVMILILAAVAGFGYFVNVLFISWAGENLTTKLRVQSYTSIIRKEISWYDEEVNSPTRISARLARDAPLIKMATGERLGVALIAIVTLTGSLFLAFYFGWRLASVSFIAFPALMLSSYAQVLVQTEGQLRNSEHLETAGNIAIESIQSISTIQSLCQEKYFYLKYKECVEPVFLEAKKQASYFGVALGVSAIVIYFFYSGTFYYGARLVNDGLMTQDSVYRVFFAISFCTVGVGHMTSLIPEFQKGRLALALVFNLTQLKSKIDPLSETGKKPQITGVVEFKDVYFSYPARPDTKVLQGLSFKVEAGKTLAVIGMSGSGKTTVVSLVERFYDVLSGAVLIDGVDIRDINISHLRKHIGLVQQEPVLFDTTIRENIAYGYVGENDSDFPSDLDIIKSARSANIHDFITKLPQGYDTAVGEKGVQLSGGQKQRVAIARALIRNPRILLLDEATSALDTESEQVVQEALDRAREGRTCIIIAHRLSTIQNADIIAVVSNGRIIEMETPEKLKAKKGIYYKITMKQQLQT